jgi:hypothetical protein
MRASTCETPLQFPDTEQKLWLCGALLPDRGDHGLAEPMHFPHALDKSGRMPYAKLLSLH